MKKRWPAFTILELMIVSVLTTILVSAAFTAFQLIDRQFQMYYHQSQSSLDGINLHRLLKEDIHQALKLEAIDDFTLVLHFENYNLQYHFASNQISRQVLLPEVLADTFQLQLKQLTFSFRGALQTNGAVDFIQCQIEKEQLSYPFTFYKPYSAAEQMQLDYAH